MPLVFFHGLNPTSPSSHSAPGISQSYSETLACAVSPS